MDAPVLNTSSTRPIVFAPNEPIYSIIDRLGKNWKIDILGRIFWYYDKLEISPERKLEIRNQNIERRKQGLPEQNDLTIDLVKIKEATSCVFTHNAIMSAFFGKWNRDSKNFRTYDEIPQIAIDEIKAAILAKESATSIAYRERNAKMGFRFIADTPLDENHWTAYSIKLFAIRPKQKDITHACVLVQFISNGTICYKILQSFVNQYPFNKHDHTYNTPQIFLMFDDILNFVLSTHWNDNHVRLFHGFFQAQSSSVPRGDPINFKKTLTIRSGDFSREDLEKHAADFRDAYPENYAIHITRNNTTPLKV